MTTSVIIGIHGLANKPPIQVKTQWWKAAILEGLTRNCARTVNTLEFDLVYWADILHKKEGPLEANDNPEPYYPENGSGGFPAYDHQTWTEFLRDIAATGIDKAGHFIDWVTRSRAVGGFIMEYEVSELHEYFYHTEFRNKVQKLLIDKLNKHSEKRIMLIAHSMGSVIAYDVLRKMGRQTKSLRVDHFVTIGSPLGLPHVVSEIYKENDLVRTPSNVGRWTNFADRRDSVAMDFRLADDYEPNNNGVKVEDLPVINNYRSPDKKPNVHKSYGYLRTPELSYIVREFI
jgi:hypothetical protein